MSIQQLRETKDLGILEVKIVSIKDEGIKQITKGKNAGKELRLSIIGLQDCNGHEIEYKDWTEPAITPYQKYTKDKWYRFSKVKISINKYNNQETLFGIDSTTVEQIADLEITPIPAQQYNTPQQTHTPVINQNTELITVLKQLVIEIRAIKNHIVQEKSTHDKKQSIHEFDQAVQTAKRGNSKTST